jgi:hypothetical protein
MRLTLRVNYVYAVLKPFHRVALIFSLGIGLRIAIHLQRETSIPFRDQVPINEQCYNRVPQTLTIVEENRVVTAAKAHDASSSAPLH